MALDLNFEKRANYGLHIRKFFLYPNFWNDPEKDIAVHKNEWKCVKFDKVFLNKVSRHMGVYAFVLKPSYPSLFETGYLFYIGKTSRTLQQRFKEYFDERDGNGKYRYLVREILRLYKEDIFFYYLELESEQKVDESEILLLNTFVPFVNTDIPEAMIEPNLKNIYKSF
jgi:hypothetical protein